MAGGGPERRCRERIERPKVNGVRIDPVTPEDFVETLSTFLSCGHSHVVHFCAAHPTVEARNDASYRAILNVGALNVPDGMPVAWAARMRVEDRAAGGHGRHAPDGEVGSERRFDTTSTVGRRRRSNSSAVSSAVP
jgi:hypothetical protein